MNSYKESENNSLQKSGIITLLKQFTPKEISEYGKLVSSPFFNNHSTLIKLFNELKKYYPDFNNKNFTKENLYKIVNSEKNYNDIVFRKYLSNLMKLGEEYLNILEARSRKEKYDLNILIQYEKRNLYDLYNRKLKSIETKQLGKNEISVDYFYNMHLLQNSKVNHLLSLNKFEFINKYVQSSQNNLLNYFLFNSVFGFKTLHSQKNTFTFSNNMSSVELFFQCFDFEKFISSLKNIRNFSKMDIDMLELIYYDFQLAQDKSEPEIYYKLKAKITECGKYFDKELSYVYMSQLNSYCLLEIASGKNDLKKELFENYKLMLENGYYELNGISSLNLSVYRAVLLSAIRVNELEWAEFFIVKYKDHIKADSRENIFNYANAILQFEKKEFLNSLKSASDLKFDSFIFHLDVNVLRLMLYYELNYITNAVSLIDSYKHFLRNSKILSEEIKLKHNNFLILYGKLIKAKEYPKETELNFLKNLIHQENSIIKKNWLLEKTVEITLNGH